MAIADDSVPQNATCCGGSFPAQSGSQPNQVGGSQLMALTKSEQDCKMEISWNSSRSSSRDKLLGLQIKEEIFAIVKFC